MHFKGQTCIFHSLFKRLITLKAYSLYIFLLNILHFSSSIQPEKKRKKLISKVFIDCIISLFISIIEKNHVNYINIFTYILQIVTDISFTWSFTNYPKPRGATTVIPRSRVLVEVRITTVLWTSVLETRKKRLGTFQSRTFSIYPLCPHQYDRARNGLL